MSFLKKGQRQDKLLKDKQTKKHIKSFYKILYEMDDLVKKLDTSIEYTEDNINDYIEDIYGRKLDNMEKFVLLGKLYHARENK